MRALLIALVLSVSSLPAQAAIPQAQRDALFALYDSTNGDAWTSHTGWRGAMGTECSWQGVFCNGAKSTVVTVALPNNNLTGSLPSQIGNLPDLDQINLQSNQLTGSIPSELGQLSKLTRLIFSSNKLSGAIPITVANLAALQYLILSSNALTGAIPPELGRLADLQVLGLDGNALSGTIPSELGSLSALRRFDLSSNQIGGTLPPALGGLSSLTAFTVGNNQLTGNLEPILSLRSLQFLSVERNQFAGDIPPALAAITTLQTLSLAGNQFTGTIPDFAALTALYAIDLSSNNLTGPIPASVGQLSNLLYATFSRNRLSGSIPASLGALGKLLQLQLDRNQLSGGIPPSIGALTSLQVLDLSFNALTGTIPSSISQLNALQVLRLASNAFTGTFPPSITQLNQLQYLNLDDCRLTGPLPTDIGRMKALVGLRLNDNQFDGAIPPSLGDLASLQSLSLSNNQLTGTLPREIGNLRALLLLSLSNNLLGGAIPPELGNLTRVQSLALYANRFEGTIPKELASLTRLDFMALSFNALRGAVPPELTQLTALRDGGSAFDHNLLSTSDPALSAFLDRKQQGGRWALFQTIPPTNVRVASITDRSATLSWDRIPIIYDEGGYQVVASASAGGPPVALATTPSKQINSVVVRGLSPDTQYFFTVSMVTHPIGQQKSLLISDPAAPVSASTTARVLSPPDVVLRSAPQGLVQIDGTPVNQDSFTLTNYGDSGTSVTISAGKTDFVSISPSTLTLAPGASGTVTLSSIAQPAGSYHGVLTVQSAGGPALVVFVALLSVARPAGTASATPVSSRIEVAGVPGSDSVGSASYRNNGTAPLSGIVVADADWVQPSTLPVQIFPGQTFTVPFTVLASKRPSDLGALSADLRLVYVGGTVSGAALHALDAGAPGVSVSVVTVVSTTKPPVAPGTVPALALGELALFAPGLLSQVQNGLTLTSDLSIANISTATPLSDLKVFFTPAGSSVSTVASFNPIATASAVSLSNVFPAVFGSASALGTLQMRSANLQQVSAFARVSGTRGTTTTSGDVPIIRSDRSANPKDLTVLTGVRGGADLFIQETAGQSVSVRIDFLDGSGAAIGATQTQTVGALSLKAWAGAVPARAVTALLTNDGPGSIGAYARIIDASGDTWSVVDWRRIQNYDGQSALRIPFFESSGGGSRRRAAPHSLALTSSNRSEVTIFNPGDAGARARIDVLDPAGRSQSQELTVGPYQTVSWSSASSTPSAQLVITPLLGAVYASCRNAHSAAGGTLGAAIPVLASATGLRLGQSHNFLKVEDPTSTTVAAAVPATYRSALGLVETSGHSATVRINIAVSETASLVSALISQSITIGPNQQILLDPLLRGLVGPTRETAFGDLHGMKVEITVTSGDGAVVPFLLVADNGSGDSYLRLD